MKLFLLPVSTRRSLLYCHHVQKPAASGATGVLDNAVNLAARKWIEWEGQKSGWKVRVVRLGNTALRRVPFEEWGLRSVPKLDLAANQTTSRDKVELSFPPSLLHESQLKKILHSLGPERIAFHKQRLLWSVLGMPLTIPFGLIPLIPNIPFFYLAYRAWSHWRALSGARHIEHLLRNGLITFAPSELLDRLYQKQHKVLASPTSGRNHSTVSDSIDGKEAVRTSGLQEVADQTEALLMSQDLAVKIGKRLALPQVEIELERAAWQVEQAAKSR